MVKGFYIFEYTEVAQQVEMFLRIKEKNTAYLQRNANFVTKYLKTNLPKVMLQNCVLKTSTSNKLLNPYRSD